MRSYFIGRFDIGVDVMVTINQLLGIMAGVARKFVDIKQIPSPTGLRGRKSENTLIKQKLYWVSRELLSQGVAKTYS